MTFFSVEVRQRARDRVLATSVTGLLREAGELGAPVEAQLRALAKR